MAARKLLGVLGRSNKLSNMRINAPPKESQRPLIITHNALLRAFSSEKTAAAEKQPPTQAAATDNLDEVTQKLTQELEQITSELNKTKKQNEELLDKYKRALAENENIRARLTKQIEDAKIYGIQGFCKDLLEVADTLGHATEAVPKEELESNAHLKNLFEGLTMTKAALLQVFKRHGLEAVNPLNEKFDPNLHEALFQIPKAEVDPNTVIEVTKLGYKLHGRIIRPALVGVAQS